MNALVRFRSMIVLVVAATVAACAMPVRPADGGPPVVRVLTWNIHAGQDLERGANLERVAALIDSVGADIVLLQEVDRNTERSGSVDQPAVLARLTGLHVEFARALDFDGGQYGIAILSRWTPSGAHVVPLDIVRPPELSERHYEPRTVLHVTVPTPGGTLHVLNTHVDHQADPTFRHLQMIELMAYITDAAPRDDAVVLGGDLNARPAAAGVRALGLRFDDAWTQCGSGSGFTFRDRRIDYIMLSGISCGSAQVIESGASDHRAVLVEIGFEAGGF